MNVANNNLKVQIWDLGPKVPVAPKSPLAPKGKDGDPDYELAKIEFEATLEAYRAALKAYGRAKQEHADWERRMGGPVGLEMWSVDAKEAVAREPERFVNRLPRGVKPGRGHQENLERQEQIAADLAVAADRDPQFGTRAAGASA